MTFPVAEYLRLREIMLADEEWAKQYAWQQTVKFPTGRDRFENFALELCFVILNSGMKNTVCHKIWVRLKPEIMHRNGRIRPSVFNHKGKCEAFRFIWNGRWYLYEQASKLEGQALVEWCGNIKWIGPITKYHAAKNLGADVAKPDRWLDRIAQESGETVDGLCRRLVGETGDRIATIDLVLWWAAAYGHWKQGADA